MRRSYPWASHLHHAGRQFTAVINVVSGRQAGPGRAATKSALRYWCRVYNKLWWVAVAMERRPKAPAQIPSPGCPRARILACLLLW